MEESGGDSGERGTANVAESMGCGVDGREITSEFQPVEEGVEATTEEVKSAKGSSSRRNGDGSSKVGVGVGDCDCGRSKRNVSWSFGGLAISVRPRDDMVGEDGRNGGVTGY